MNLYTLLTNMADVLEADSTLNDWISSTYSTTLKTFIGIDNRMPPGEDNCPCVILFPAGKVAGDGVEQKEHVIKIRVAIAKDGKTESEDRTTYTGINHIVACVWHVINALASNLDTIGLTWMSFESHYDEVEHYPVFFCDLMVTFIQHLSTTVNVYD